MRQSDVWKRKRSGLAGTLRDGRKAWLSSGHAGTDVEERKQGQETDGRPWLVPRAGAASRLSED